LSQPLSVTMSLCFCQILGVDRLDLTRDLSETCPQLSVVIDCWRAFSLAD